MPPFGPISRKDLVKHLRQYGFEGPFAGTKHQLMSKGSITIRIPNPHQSVIGRELLMRILRHAHISKDMWEQL